MPKSDKSVYMEKYDDLFSNSKYDVNAKAEAFDKLAACYYDCNFGTMPKSEIDLLMFSIFLDQAMAKSNQDYTKFDDYALSKQFGITQTRLASLRERKALKYPSPNTDWLQRLVQLSNNVRYENGYIKLTIPERDIFLEVEHAIQVNGGTIDIGNNPKLLKIDIKDYIDLMLMLDTETTNPKQVWKKVEEHLQKNNCKFDIKKTISISEALKNASKDLIIDVIGAVIPVVGPSISSLVKNVYEKIKATL